MDWTPRLPDWILPWLAGGFLWFGFVYLFVAPELTQRAVDRHIAAECRRTASTEDCECLLHSIHDSRMKHAVFISTLGYSDSRPRGSVYGGSDNGFIQYIAREARDPQRRNDCAKPQISNGSVMSPEQEAAAERNQQRIEEALAEQRRIAEKTAAETQRLTEEAQQRAADEAQRVVEAAEQAAVDALNCELGDSVLVDDAERKCRLTKEVNEEMMSWGELAAEKSRQIRWNLRRKWGL